MLLSTGIILVLGLASATAQAQSFVEIPVGPRLCYSCEGIKCQQTTWKNKVVQCTDQLDVCVTVFDGFRVSERGCLLELSLAARAKCAAKDIQCLKCIGDICNDKGRIDHQCIECHSLEDTRCYDADDGLTPTHCDAPTSPNAYCYVKHEQNRLSRGCALSLLEQKSCLEDKQCSLCNPEDVEGSGPCNTYQLGRSGAAQIQILGLCLGMMSLLTIQVLN